MSLPFFAAQKNLGSFKFRCSSVERCSPAAWQDIARPWGPGMSLVSGMDPENFLVALNSVSIHYNNHNSSIKIINMGMLRFILAWQDQFPKSHDIPKSKLCTTSTAPKDTQRVGGDHFALHVQLGAWQL